MRIAAVTTVYYPDEDFLLKNYLQVNKYLYKYIIVNNSPDYQFLKIKDDDNIIIITSENSGVSGGANTGIKYANSLSCNYVIFFDQDSLCDVDMLSQMISSLKLFDNNCIIAPNVLNYSNIGVHDKYFSKGTRINQRYIEIPTTQLSGMMVPLYLFDNIGLFDENYFLNFVDTEWCWRAIANNYKIIIDTDAKLYHAFGEGKKKLIFYNFYINAPFRMYYASRDSLFLITEAHIKLFVKAKVLIKLLVTFIEIFVQDYKMKRYYYLFKGILDFICGVRGNGLR